MPTFPVTDETFNVDVLESALPVLVDFWAEWCGPCHMVAPVLEQMSEEFAGRVLIAKVNVDDNPEVAARFGITGIPTMMLFRDGEVVKSMIGARPRAAIVSDIEPFLE